MIITSKVSFSKFAIYCVIIIILLCMLNACTTLKVNTSNPVVLPVLTSILVGPMANHTDTPLANRQVEAITLSLLHSKGFSNSIAYPRQQSCEKLLYCPDEAIATKHLITWARQHHMSYILTGAANEWRYKVGLDGEPVAGVSLLLINTQTGRTVWSGVGSVIGGSRSGLEVVGQTLINTLLSCYKTV